MKSTLLALTLILAVLCTAAFTQQPSQPQWEYQFVFDCTEKKANALGAQGWQLTAIQGSGPGIGNNVATYVFKRAK
jgi:hypothetical protein